MRPRYSSRQSKNFTARRHARNLSRIINTVGIVCIVFLVVWGISLFDRLAIRNVQIAGLPEEESSTLHDEVMNILSGSYLGLFPRNNLLIYPRSRIDDFIDHNFQDVESVKIDNIGGQTILISVKEKKPIALICASLPDFDGNDISIVDSGECYFGDKDGKLFKKSPTFSGAVYNRYYIPDLVPIIGTLATSTDEFNIIQGVYTTVQNNNIKVDAVLMKGNGEYELYIRNPGLDSSTAIVYFNTISPVAEQISNLISFWDHTLSEARSKKQSVVFDYIDVRYSPNVYHRFAK